MSRQGGQFNNNKFQNRREIIHIGVHCRELKYFKSLAASKVGSYDYIYILSKNKKKVKLNNSINILNRLSDLDYNSYLASSVVFLQLSAATASNTILECIARGTPIIVNPIGGVREYLGEHYPLYYNNYDEAKKIISSISNNPKILLKAHNYLLSISYKYNKKIFIKNLEDLFNKWKYEK